MNGPADNGGKYRIVAEINMIPFIDIALGIQLFSAWTSSVHPASARHPIANTQAPAIRESLKAS